MSSRAKEEERIEKILRGLLKQQENRRCINCNLLGPQYVCTTFWTFVCTSCSGVHREFTHRVKSISMAKFTADEVSALQAGGNEQARKVYFKTWDPHRNSYPDRSNLHRLRDFIKHVYVDRRFTGEPGSESVLGTRKDANASENYSERKSFERPSQATNDEIDARHSFEKFSSLVKKEEFFEKRSSAEPRDDFFERRSFDRSTPGSRDEYFERRSFERSIPKRADDRNLRHYTDDRRGSRTRPQSAKARNRHARFEIVDDRFRDDGQGYIRKIETRGTSNADSMTQSMPPEHQKLREISSLQVVRSVKDILSEDAPPLKIGEAPKAKDRKDSSTSASGQKTPPSDEQSSVDSKVVESKTTDLNSLIDFNPRQQQTQQAIPPTLPPTQEIAPSTEPPTQETATSTNDGKSSVPSSTPEKASKAPKMNTLEFLLFELSPEVEPAGCSPQIPNCSDDPLATPVAPPTSVTATVNPTTTHALAFPRNESAHGASTAGNTQALPNTHGNCAVKVDDGRQVANMQQNQASATAGGYSSSNTQHDIPTVATLYNQPWSSSALNDQGSPPNAVAEQSSAPNALIPILAPNAHGPPPLAPNAQAPPSALNAQGFYSASNAQGSPSARVSQRPYLASNAQGSPSAPNAQGSPSALFSQRPYSAPNAQGSPSTQNAEGNPSALNAQRPYSAPNDQGSPASPPFEPSFQAASNAAPDTSTGEGAKSSGRKELPVELFTSGYSAYSAAAPSWQFRPPQAMAYNMQYHPNAMNVSAFTNAAKATNPFDDSPQVQAPMFPSMSSLQGALPHSPTPAGLQPPSPYLSAMYPQSSPYGIAVPPGAYMGQHMPNSIPLSRPEGLIKYGSGEAPFASNPVQHPNSHCQGLNAPYSFPTAGGNPFG